MSKKKSKIRPGRGTLWIIAGLLLTSAAIRAVTGASTAIARESEEIPHQAPMMAEVPMKPELCVGSEHISGLLETLAKRESMLDDKEKSLQDRMAALSLAEQEIRENLKALEEAEAELTATMALAEGASENDLSKLTTVYENMKPKAAAPLFEAMAPEFAAGFLARMRPDAAALILANLDAERAYTISVILAGRNANVPKE